MPPKQKNIDVFTPYLKIPNLLMKLVRYRIIDLCSLIILCKVKQFDDNKAECFITYDQWAIDLGVSPTTIKKSINTLLDKKLLWKYKVSSKNKKLIIPPNFISVISSLLKTAQNDLKNDPENDQNKGQNDQNNDLNNDQNASILGDENGTNEDILSDGLGQNLTESEKLFGQIPTEWAPLFGQNPTAFCKLLGQNLTEWAPQLGQNLTESESEFDLIFGQNPTANNIIGDKFNYSQNRNKKTDEENKFDTQQNTNQKETNKKETNQTFTDLQKEQIKFLKSFNIEIPELFFDWTINQQASYIWSFLSDESKDNLGKSILGFQTDLWTKKTKLKKICSDLQNGLGWLYGI